MVCAILVAFTAVDTNILCKSSTSSWLMITPIIKINKSGFNEFIGDIDTPEILSFTPDSGLSLIIKAFFNRIISTAGDRKFFILLRLHYDDDSIRTLHKGLIVKHASLNEYITLCKNLISIKSNDYTARAITKVTFNYFMIDLDREQYYIDKWTELDMQNTKPISLTPFGKYKLPSNNNYSSWGVIMSETDKVSVIASDNYIYVITHLSETETEIKVFKNKKLIITFTDVLLSRTDVDAFFKRVINSMTYYIRNGAILLSIKELETKFLKTLKRKNVPSANKIITFDIETLLIDGQHKPYLYSMYDGKRTYSWFTDSPQSLFDQLLRRKYKNFVCYAHNLSGFDIVFIFRYLAVLHSQGYKITILKKDEKIININIASRKDNISIDIRDSFLILPFSLSKLALQFNVETSKGIEPVLTGKGACEHPEYAMSDFKHYSKDIELVEDFNLWKQKVQQYCEHDSISLHQVLVKFRSLVKDKWGLDITKYPTTPSLAFAIYRSSYLKDHTIPITQGEVYDFIKESFTGGATEMYKPVSSSRNIYCYDVNSLYPFVMANNKFPVGQILQFEGDPTILSQDDYYWIGDVEVQTKKNLYSPYLQIHHNITGAAGGMRTISPNGAFRMKINSPEYYNSLKDYNIVTSRGYIFRKEDIFSSFINDLYKIRCSYPKSDPMNMISRAKHVMNSCYGRFAMAPIRSVQAFVNKEEFLRLSEKFEILEYIDLIDTSPAREGTDTSLFVNYLDPSLLHKESKTSIGIASAVTSYARVHMSQFKYPSSQYKLYYTDTDSIYIDKPLDDSLVSDVELGKFKLEHVFKEAVFLGPKIYAGITTDDKYICKVKGFKDPKTRASHVGDMKTLLAKDTHPKDD